MVIAVAVKSPVLNAALSEIFDKSNYFMIYNSDDRNIEFIANPYASELGGAGIQAARMLICKCINLIITNEIGKNPLRIFAFSDIDVYQCKDGTAQNILQLFQEGKLSKIKILNPNSLCGKNINKYKRKFLRHIFSENFNK